MYTAISRTKRACYLVGHMEAIRNSTMIRQKNKYENLGVRLYLLKNIDLEKRLIELIPDDKIQVMGGISGGIEEMQDIGYNSDDF